MHSSIGSFLDSLKIERQASPHTLRSYHDDLEVFCRFLEESQGEGYDPTTVDSARLRRYSAWLNSQGYAATTIARRLASLRSFFRYLRRQRQRHRRPLLGLAQSQATQEVASPASNRRRDPPAGCDPGGRPSGRAGSGHARDPLRRRLAGQRAGGAQPR